MHATTLTYIGKTTWGTGEWQQEPDIIRWGDKDYVCLIKRHPEIGHLCGYVGVNKDHPLYGKSYMYLCDNEIDFDVHGGITWADSFRFGEEDNLENTGFEKGDEDRWWFGFDCGHAWDISPELHPLLRDYLSEAQTYRDISYVRKHVTRLYQKLLEIELEQKERQKFMDLTEYKQEPYEIDEAMIAKLTVAESIEFIQNIQEICQQRILELNIHGSNLRKVNASMKESFDKLNK